MSLNKTDRNELKKLIKNHFNLKELKGLCFELEIIFEDLPGTTLDEKVIELIEFCKRHGRLDDLFGKLKNERPNVEWSVPLSSLSISQTLYTESESLDRTSEAEIPPLYDKANDEPKDNNDQSEQKHKYSTKEGRTYNLGERSSGTTGIPSNLNQELRKVLLRCGPFETQGKLRSIFVDKRLAPWQYQLPQTNSSEVARVESVINFLHNKCNDAGENALVLLIRVLRDRLNDGDACRTELAQLANKLESETICPSKLRRSIKWIGFLLLLLVSVVVIRVVPPQVPTAESLSTKTPTTVVPVPAQELLPTPPDICPIEAVQFSRDGGQLLPENERLQLSPNQLTEVTARIESLPGCNVSVIWGRTDGQFLSVGGRPCDNHACSSSPNRTYPRQGKEFSEFEATYKAPESSGTYRISLIIEASSERASEPTIKIDQITVEVR